MGLDMKEMNLNFGRIAVCRREDQIKAATGVVDKVVADGGRQYCLIQGKVGSGKGLLCKEIERHVQDINEKKGAKDEPTVLVVQGIFAEGGADATPLHAANESVSTIYSQLISGHHADLWRKRFDEGLGLAQKAVLGALVASIREDNEKHGKEAGVTIPHWQRMVESSSFFRFVYAVRAFFRILCKHARVVWIMQEIQNATVCSVLLLQTVLGDKADGFVFVGTHREMIDLPKEKITAPCDGPDGDLTDAPEEKEQEPIGIEGEIIECKELHASDFPMAKFRAFLPQDSLTDLELTELGLPSIIHMIRDLFGLQSLDDHKIKPLAELLFRKTGGNYFFVKHALKLLEQQGFIRYDPVSFGYVYQDRMDDMKETLALSDNMLDVVAVKMKLLPLEQRQVLMHASCLQVVKFEAKGLFHTFVRPDAPSFEGKEELMFQSVDELKRVLFGLVDEGLLEVIDDEKGIFVFNHPSIRESAYATIPDKANLHISIGRRLLQMLTSTSEAGNPRWAQPWFMHAVRQLNKGLEGVQEHEKPWLADLNYQAGHASMIAASFFPAMDYLKVGIDLLEGSSGWKGDNASAYETMLGATSDMARILLSIGEIDASRNLLDQVLENGKTLQEKLPAYYMKVVGLAKQGKIDDSFDLIQYVLKQLGVMFPKKGFIPKVRLNRAISKAKQRLIKTSDEELIAMAGPDEGPLFHAIDFILYLRELSTLTGKVEYVKLARMWMAENAVKYGPISLKSISIATWSMWFAAEGDLKLSERFGKLAMVMSSKTKEQSAFFQLHTKMLYYSYCHHWKNPYHNTLPTWINTNETVLEQGYTEALAFGMLGYSSVYFCSGLNLAPLERDLQNSYENLSDYGYTLDRDRLGPILQLVLNLMGKSEEPNVLTGEVMDVDKLAKEYSGDHEQEEVLRSIWLARMVLSYYMGEYAEAYAMAKKLNACTDALPSVFLPFQTFYHACTCFALARSSSMRKQKFKREGNKLVARFESWVGGGAINCLHMLKLLMAEQLSVTSNKIEEVRRAYNESIAASARIGFIQDRSLANERAGLYFLDKGDKERAKSYLGQAHDLYETWGALAKVRRLEKDHPHLFRESNYQSGFCRGGAALRAKEGLKEVHERMSVSKEEREKLNAILGDSKELVK